MTKYVDIWKLDTSEMTLDELEGYKAELQRLDKLSSERHARNIRLVIYAVALILLVAILAWIPGFVRYQQGPVTLVPATDPQIRIEKGLGDGFCERNTDHSFTAYFPVRDSDRGIDGYRLIRGTICQEPERLNRQGKSSVSFSDGTTGKVWYNKKGQSGRCHLVVEYKGHTYEYPWCFAEDLKQKE